MGFLRMVREMLNPKDRPICKAPIEEFISQDLKNILRKESDCHFRIDQEGKMEIIKGHIENYEQILEEIKESELVEHLSLHNSTYYIIAKCRRGKFSIKLEKPT